MKKLGDVLTLLLVIGIVLGIFYVLLLESKNLEKMTLKNNPDSPPPTSIIAVKNGKMNPYYIHRFDDGNTICYVYKDTISCVKR